MAFNNYLIKIGNYTIPYKFMKIESYNATLYGQDMDSYNDANGDLQRNALQNGFTPKVEFNTPALLTQDEVEELFSNIRANYINRTERKLHASIYMPELNDYVEQDVYMPDTKFEVYSVHTGKIQYNPIRLAFIGYGGATNG